ncbi:hypothetical protein [Bradyrhizobium sp.]|uniref:hypothetical protein n=1 Tax=Bradyrhizobium sp. TaxID=376 RepID=UPI0025B8121B|nr:hypothetical protein [Bradyrhizobium sp.]
MQQLSRLVMAASAAAFLSLPTCAALAQSVPNAGAATAASSTAAPEAAGTEKPAPKKKKPTKMTRKQEIDQSIDRGTVPARYRSSVPKEYHQYIPFDKR